MAGTRNNGVGRLAAMAAADRVKLLLTMVDEDDDFLAEILESADRSMDGFRRAQMAAASRPAPTRERPRSVNGDGAVRSLLGPTYHAAKKRSLEARRSSAAPQRPRTTGRS